MICTNCKTGRPKLQRQLYRYQESGLPNVFLRNVKWWKCPHCEATQVDIPKVGQLHRSLSWLIVAKPSLLTGPEIVFLRRVLGKNQKDMAEYLGIQQVVLSRWETEARSHGKANDSLIRLSYLLLQNDEYTRGINREFQTLLFRYFGHVRDSAAPVKASIDPNHYEPGEIIRTSVARLASIAGTHISTRSDRTDRRR